MEIRKIISEMKQADRHCISYMH